MTLNKEQAIIVNELKENILLLASAGTGKTNTLSYRISNIIKSKKAKAEEILCITFTNKACAEMKERIESIVGDKAMGITIRTFHSFCFDLIKREAKKRTDIFTDFLVFDEDDCKEIIKEVIKTNYPVNKLQQFIELVKIEKVRSNIRENSILKSYNEVINNIFEFQYEKIKNICSDRGKVNIEMLDYLKNKGGELVILYNSHLYNNHGLDFADLTIKAKELFKDKNLVEGLKNKFKYINIDEVQDTSTLEYSIIEKIFGDNNILLCGDIFQTIYGWRGSEPESILNLFKEKYNPKEVVFTKNYRSTKYITEASLSYLENSFLEKYSSVYKEKIVSNTEVKGEKVKFKILNNLREEARFIFEEINRLAKNGEDTSKACILCRDNKYSINLSKELSNIIGYEGADFEFILVDQYKFFRRQEIKDIIAFLKLIANRYDNVSLKRILKRLPTGIGDTTIKAIESREYKELGIALSDFIDKNTKEYGEKNSLLIKEFKNNNIVVFDVESTGTDVTEDEIIQIAAIRIDNKGKVIDKFEKFLINKKSVTTSYKIHGFTDDFLKENGEDKKKVLKEFIEFSKDSIIVGHNVQYDINILNSELSRNNLVKHNFKGFYDTLDIYRRFYSNVENHKLETLSKVFNTENKPSHDAMDDILATKDLLVRAIIEDLIPTSLSRMSLITKHLKAFDNISRALNELFDRAEEKRPYEIIVDIINGFNIKSLYTGRIVEVGEDAKEKLERLRDFYVLVKELDVKEKSNKDSLLDIIRITGLSNGELESLIINRTKKKRIPIITVHQAKGLEFDTVMIVGLQQGVFPSYMSLITKNLEEEKRTFYVALTRSKKHLYLTCTRFGEYGKRNEISEFIGNINKKYMDNNY